MCQIGTHGRAIEWANPRPPRTQTKHKKELTKVQFAENCISKFSQKNRYESSDKIDELSTKTTELLYQITRSPPPVG